MVLQHVRQGIHLTEEGMPAGRAAAATGQSGLMALYDNLFTMMDLQAAQVCYSRCPLCRTCTLQACMLTMLGLCPHLTGCNPQKFDALASCCYSLLIVTAWMLSGDKVASRTDCLSARQGSAVRLMH